MIEEQPTFRLGWNKKKKRRRRRKKEKKPSASVRTIIAQFVRKWLPAAVIVTVVIGYVAVAYLVLPAVTADELPAWWQRLLGLAYGALAVLIFTVVTRPTESPEEEWLQRVQRGQHADFGKRLRKAQEKRTTVRLPVLGETSRRKLGGTVVFLAAAGWWLSPLAPVGIRPKWIEDLNAPLAEEIVAAVMVMADGQVATVQPPVPSPRARQVAAQIDSNDNTYLRALKAIAESRFQAAPKLLALAMSTDAAKPQQINVARAQNFMYAGEFSTAAQWYEDALRNEPDDPMLLCQAAVAWMQAGAYDQARPLVDQALTFCREDLSEDDPLQAVCLHLQAVLQVTLDGRYAEAETACLRAREIYKKSFDPQHSFIAASVNNQAVARLLQARYAGAEGLLAQWAHNIWTRAFGPQDLHVAAGLGNLAIVRYHQGRYANTKTGHQADNEAGNQARETLEQALAIQDSAIRGARVHPGHPALAAVRSEGAVLYRALGQYQKAQDLAQDALAICEKALGAEHPDVAVALDTLACIHCNQARYAKAESYYLRAIDISEKTWGPEHPYLTGILNHLARLYILQGRLDDAEIQCQRALEISQRTFGEKHPGVGTALHTCGSLELARGQSREARQYLEKALAIRQEAFGPEHPDLARTLGCLAALDNSPLSYTKGVDRYERALETAEKLLGHEHPEVAGLCCGLAALYVQNQRYEKAEPFLQRALTIQDQALVPFHPELAATLEAYASLLLATNPSDPHRAEAMRERAKAIRARHSEEDQPD